MASRSLCIVRAFLDSLLIFTISPLELILTVQAVPKNNINIHSIIHISYGRHKVQSMFILGKSIYASGMDAPRILILLSNCLGIWPLLKSTYAAHVHKRYPALPIDN